MRPTPDADGVTRVFPSELWDDPKIGTILREAGFAPDDARNILPTAEDYIALFDAAKQRYYYYASNRNPAGASNLAAWYKFVVNGNESETTTISAG